MNNQRVIKADSLRELGRKVLFDFEDFHKRCDDHLTETRQKAEQFLTEAQQQAQLLEEQARQRGFEAGYAAGMEKAEAEIHSRAETQAKAETQKGLEAGQKVIGSLAKAVADARVEWQSRWESAAIQLCIAIAEKIIRTELAHRPELSQTMIQKLLEIASSEELLMARVHPEDAPFFQESSSSVRFHQIVEIRPDDSLSRGDCIVELRQGELDGRVATQLRRLMEELTPVEETPTDDR